MALIEVDAAKCKKDGLCVAVCPSKVLEEDKDGGPVVADPELCNDCGHCLAVCPHGALTHARLGSGVAGPAPRHFPAPETVDDLLRGRRSIRSYCDKPVPREVLTGLIDVARYAPTASNAQEIRWIATDDPARVRQLAALTAAWFTEHPGRPVQQKYVALWNRGLDTFLRGAPALVVVHTVSDAPFGAADCGIALTFLELAAVARGLGTCWAGLLTMVAAKDAAMRQALGLPEGHAVHGGLMLGYPKVRYAGVPVRNPASVSWL
jgi:nitroreductase/NAD-dependent dihydropyrimidine dehydrogenase PreA subunit